jgi:hypothetical protein
MGGSRCGARGKVFGGETVSTFATVGVIGLVGWSLD